MAHLDFHAEFDIKLEIIMLHIPYATLKSDEIIFHCYWNNLTCWKNSWNVLNIGNYTENPETFFAFQDSIQFSGRLHIPSTHTHTFLPYYHYHSFLRNFSEISQKSNSPITKLLRGIVWFEQYFTYIILNVI